MPLPEAQMTPLGEPGDDAIHQSVQPSDCHLFATIKTEPWDILGDTHDGTPFIDAMENSVPSPRIFSQLTSEDWMVQQNVDE